MITHFVVVISGMSSLANLFNLLEYYLLIGKSFVSPASFIDSVLLNGGFKVLLNLGNFSLFKLERRYTLSVVHESLSLKCLCDVVLLSASKDSLKLSFSFEVSEALEASSMLF